MRTLAQQAGDAAEELVASRLTAEGWRILGRNVRVGRAELDIVAVDPAGPTLVIVEVRWRQRREYGFAEETVDHRKWSRLRAAAYALMDRGAAPDAPGPGGLAVPRLGVRLDLVVVEPGNVLRHHRYVG
jgi:Holliday junction resolvase-like predicted endonuclease